MKSIASTSAAVVVAVLGLGMLAPVAAAQDQDPQAAPQDARHGFDPHRFKHHGPGPGGMHGGLLGLVCSQEGAERLEHMLVAISHRMELTAEQTSLFDDLKGAALTAQTSFADTCASLLPGAGQTAERSNLVERLQTRIEIDEARTAALSGLLPYIEAFYNSLTDEQKEQLDTLGERRREHIGKRRGFDRRPGQHRQIAHQS